MSVRCISQVLDLSQHAGTELLMLVVIADYSDDDGNSYPAVASLARKCRMSPRNANYILTALQASGELRVMKNEGPKGTNRYRLMLSALGTKQPLKPAAPLKRSSPLKPAAPLTPEAGCIPPEAGFPKPLKPNSDEPSLNLREEKRARVKAALTPLPQDFAISERVRDWAVRKGFSEFMEAHLEHFVSSVKASAKRYAEWDEALMTYVRCDYGDVRKKAMASGGRPQPGNVFAGAR